MKESLKPGLMHEFQFVVTDAKTVPSIYPEAPDFQTMPRVFATGYMVALLEWACIDAIKSHLDWPAEQSVGTHINVSHLAATPPGLTVTVQARLDEVDGKRLKFTVSAHDGVDTITEGTHERFVIDAEKFNARLQKKIPT
ncbi:MAG: thioesterase family protein [Immundisolibacter sp.]|uniref:thioesterase family protein n=1 Tax=Immundisolibacter sp. TaxID=1934948 RepID=UPI003EE092C2